MLGERLEVSPAHEAVVEPPPGGLLVLRPGDDPGSAVPFDRQAFDRLGLGGDEDELAADVLPFVVRRLRAGADVDELRLGAAADAVLGQADGLVGPGGDAHRIHPATVLLALLPELGEARVPGGPRALRPVEDRAVGRKLDQLGLRETELGEAGADDLCGGPIAVRDAHAVVERESAHVRNAAPPDTSCAIAVA